MATAGNVTFQVIDNCMLSLRTPLHPWGYPTGSPQTPALTPIPLVFPDLKAVDSSKILVLTVDHSLRLVCIYHPFGADACVCLGTPQVAVPMCS